MYYKLAMLEFLICSAGRCGISDARGGEKSILSILQIKPSLKCITKEVPTVLSNLVFQIGKKIFPVKETDIVRYTWSEAFMKNWEYLFSD